jgi:heme exporter protein C
MATGKMSWLLPAVVAVGLAAAMIGVFVLAPREQSMGDVQRLVYVHVPMAWLGLLGFLLAAGFGVLYIVRRNPYWDEWAQATAEVGWLCETLTLATGSLWAHEAWNTWWTWDPRLTTSLILWLIYGGYFLLRASVSDRARRARVAAIVSVVGIADVPLVIMATRWYRGIHPVSPEMEPSMYAALLGSAAAFLAMFALLVATRRRQLALGRQIETIWRQEFAPFAKEIV